MLNDDIAGQPSQAEFLRQRPGNSDPDDYEPNRDEKLGYGKTSALQQSIAYWRYGIRVGFEGFIGGKGTCVAGKLWIARRGDIGNRCALHEIEDRQG